MNHLTKTCLLILLSLALLFLPVQIAHTISTAQDPKPPEPTQKDQRGVGVQAASPIPTSSESPGTSQSPGTPDQSKTTQAKSGAAKPEIVLQAGITVPQTQISFSLDGRPLYF